jgi:hypothetical protein
MESGAFLDGFLGGLVVVPEIGSGYSFIERFKFF